MNNSTLPNQGSATSAHLFLLKTDKPVGPPIAYDPAHAVIAGDPTSGILLGQIVYWASVMRAKYGDKWDGWFYKTADEWEKETGLSRSMQETARAKFARTGVVIFSNKGQVCGKLSFKLDESVYSCLMAQIRGFTKPESQKSQTAFGKSPKQIRKSAKAITENTQEITNKNTTNSESVVVDKLKFEETPAQAVDLLQRLFDKGMTPDFADQCLKKGFEECELQLHRLSREKGVKTPHKWLYKAIMGRHRDSDAYRKPDARPYTAPTATDASKPTLANGGLKFVPQGVTPVSKSPRNDDLSVLPKSPPKAQSAINRRLHVSSESAPATIDREALLRELADDAPRLTEAEACDAVFNALPEAVTWPVCEKALVDFPRDPEARKFVKRTWILEHHSAAVAAKMEAN